MNSKILFQDELIHPIFQVIGTLVITSGGYAIFNDVIDENFINIQSFLFWVLISLIVYCIVKTSRQVRIEKSQLIKGVYLGYIGFVYKEKSLSLSKIIEIEMTQKGDKYFYIIAKTFNDELLVIKEPNRIPAQKRLDLVRSYFNLKSQ
ncbi:hypothetical protein [Winogradskyella flava]|uniref:hypothetical protein n=1 Tax=Winogradskyella flava TaxID=1884876 RepID=UPI00248FA831|nr:hypothetical protein [Winogradskyella flava]